MSDESPKNAPGRSPQGEAKKAERDERAARQLRENLKRRKRQLQARQKNDEKP